jgi:hypothetical protein
LILLAHPTRFERVTFAFGELKASDLRSVFNVGPFPKHRNKARNVGRYADKPRTSGEGRRGSAQEIGMMVPVNPLQRFGRHIQVSRSFPERNATLHQPSGTRVPQDMRRNILEICALASRGKAPLDILQPRTILIYDEAKFGTTAAGATKMRQEPAPDRLACPAFFRAPLARRVEIDSCAV